MKELIVLKEPTGKITTAKDLFNKIKRINIDYTQENFVVFYLNSSNQVIDKEILFKGGLTACMLDPRTIFRKALLKNTNSIIVAHNHPSGNLTPSENDKDILRELRKAGDFLKLKVLDSIVFNKQFYYSMIEDITK